MKRIFHHLFLLLVLLSAISGCAGQSPCEGISAPGLACIDAFEGGVLYETTGEGGGIRFKVLALSGSWYEMGKQYGRLAAGDIDEFYETIVVDYLMREHGVSYGTIRDQAYAYDDQRFPYFQELVAGMGEGLGSAEKAVVASSLIELVDLARACSSMAAWGEYTSDGPLVVGRNWDLGPPYAEYRKFMSVVVYNPEGGATGLADISFIGEISLQTGMNSRGIFLDVQNGSLSDPTPPIETRRYPTYMLSDILLTSQTMEELEGYVLDPENLPQLSMILNVADPGEDRVFEWATYDVKERMADGLIASSNHFIEPSWTDLPPVEPGAAGEYSLERLANLLALGEQYKGYIDAERMRDIFDTAFDDGGPTFPEYTVYQVVATPADRTIWLKTPGLSGWERVELGSLFISQ